MYFRLCKWCETQKQIWAIFLFKFKMGQEARDNSQHQQTHLAQELLTNVQCSGGSRSCAQETSLDDKEHGGQPQEADNNELRAPLTDPLPTTQEVAPKLNVNHSTVLQHWNKLERWKSLISGCLMSWPKIKKIVILKCRLLLSYPTTTHFSIGLWCAT